MKRFRAASRGVRGSRPAGGENRQAAGPDRCVRPSYADDGVAGGTGIWVFSKREGNHPADQVAFDFTGVSGDAQMVLIGRAVPPAPASLSERGGPIITGWRRLIRGNRGKFGAGDRRRKAVLAMPTGLTGYALGRAVGRRDLPKRRHARTDCEALPEPGMWRNAAVLDFRGLGCVSTNGKAGGSRRAGQRRVLGCYGRLGNLIACIRSVHGGHLLPGPESDPPARDRARKA